MDASIGQRLEKYTIQHPNEVLLVTVTIEGEADQIAIFRGFSSSLMRSTAFDPDVPVLPDHSTIITIDRLAAPYNPTEPYYLERGLTWEMMEVYL
jgi:hypothetical protein